MTYLHSLNYDSCVTNEPYLLNVPNTYKGIVPFPLNPSKNPMLMPGNRHSRGNVLGISRLALMSAYGLRNFNNKSNYLPQTCKMISLCVTFPTPEKPPCLPFFPHKQKFLKAFLLIEPKIAWKKLSFAIQPGARELQ